MVRVLDPLVEVGKGAHQFTGCAGISWTSDVAEKGAIQEHVPYRLYGRVVTPTHGTDGLVVVVLHFETIQVMSKCAMASDNLGNKVVCDEVFRN